VVRYKLIILPLEMMDLHHLLQVRLHLAQLHLLVVEGAGVIYPMQMEEMAVQVAVAVIVLLVFLVEMVMSLL